MDQLIGIFHTASACLTIITVIFFTIGFNRIKQQNSKLIEVAAARKQSEERYRMLVEKSPESIIVMNQKSEILYINPAGVQSIEAHSEEEIIGRSLEEFILPSDYATVEERKARLFAGETLSKQSYRLKTRQNNMIDYEISTILTVYQGEMCFLVIGEDITSRKQSEAALTESEEQYRVLQESLDHFSQDLFKVMKISDLEERLIFELKEILKLEDIFIIEIDDRLNLYRGTGGTADFHEWILQVFDHSVPIGEIVTVGQGGFVKIGETNGRIFLLGGENTHGMADSLPHRIWLQTIARYVSVLYENLYTIEDLANELEESYKEKKTPTWVLRLLFLVAEKERIKLSADLHDAVLQNQIIWYRKLQALRTDSIFDSAIHDELLAIEHGLLDIIHQIRATCNDLRPPYLKKLGLMKALENLFSYIKPNASFEIQFDYGGLKHEINEEQMITLYRVTQELLANARKHSQATMVEFSISSMDDTIYYHYQDNGIGMELDRTIDSFEHIGLNGIHKRVDSMEGEIELYAAPGKGVNLLITIPVKQSGLQNMVFEVFK